MIDSRDSVTLDDIRDPNAPTLVFLHANGFPSGAYRKMLDELGKTFDVRAPERLGHDSRYPITDGWRNLVDEVLDYVESLNKPVTVAGHSLGGYLGFLAAIRDPKAFSAIIMLDSPLIGYWKGAAFSMIKRVGLVDRVTPAGITRRRRSSWESATEASNYFFSRQAFASFDPDCLADYLRSGTSRGANGVHLRFDPELEYQIYRAIPHDMARSARRLRVPAAFIGGRQSREIRRVGLALTRRICSVSLVPGSHLFPLEQPLRTAEEIVASWRRLATR